MINDPEPEEAPVTEPVIAPIDQVKVLGVEASKARPGPVPLQMVALVALVSAGIGFTVTVMVRVLPAQAPLFEVGVTRY